MCVCVSRGGRRGWMRSDQSENEDAPVLRDIGVSAVGASSGSGIGSSATTVRYTRRGSMGAISAQARESARARDTPAVHGRRRRARGSQ